MIHYVTVTNCHNLIDILPQVKDAIENIGQTIVSSMEGCFSAKDTDAIIRVKVAYFFTVQMGKIFSRE